MSIQNSPSGFVVRETARIRSSRIVSSVVALGLIFSSLAASADKRATAPEFIQVQPGQCAIENILLEQAKAQTVVTFWVVLKDQADLRPGRQMRDWKTRGEFVYGKLTEAAQRSQTPLRKVLQQRGAGFQPFWIINALSVTGDRALINELASRPEVLEIRADRLYKVPDGTLAIIPPSTNGIEWNINRIGAPTVWANYGSRGEGIVVCNIDTGVQFTHPALINQYRGNTGGSFDHSYNWFDAAHQATFPTDNQGHGTHTMGTMVGDDGQGHAIGVAPAARWIAAKGCDGAGGCTAQSLMACAQWILAPTDLAGQIPRPDLRPNIVNNSWGGDFGGDPWFKALVQQWVAAGIFPVFSAGNFGDFCWTVASPADYPESYSVGAFDIDNHLAYFSAAGPSMFGVGKPNISAPGFNVLSSVPNGYAVASGTSMAAPHVAGAVALLWSAAPALKGDIEATRALLGNSAIKVGDARCGGFVTNNNLWGEGRLDISIAVGEAPRGPVGTLRGGVTNSVSGLPIAGAVIKVTGPMEASALTDSNGLYTLPSLVIGTYTVDARAYGFLDQTYGSVGVDGGVTPNIQNVALQPAPAAYRLSGRVSDSGGIALPGARVQILNSTNSPVLTAADGSFEITAVPQGTYEVRAEANCCVLPLTQALNLDADAAGFDFPLARRVDAFGYECQSVTPAFVQGNTGLNLNGDDFYTTVRLPFPFAFYGRSYTTGYVTCNGFLTFNAQRATDYLNSGLPSEFYPNAAIYAFWDDLFIDPTNDVFTAVSGIAPNRQFVIEWRNIRIRGKSQTFDFEIILKENGAILAQYRRLPANPLFLGAGATLGIENEDGSVALNFSTDQPSLSGPDFAILYSRPPTAYVQGHVRDANDNLPIPRGRLTITRGVLTRTITTDESGFFKTPVALGFTTLEANAFNYLPGLVSIDLTQTNGLYLQDFSLATPRAEVLPGSVQFAMGTGQTKTLTFTITNSGGATLEWSIGQADANKLAAMSSPPIFNKDADPSATSTRGLYLQEPSISWPALPGDVIKSWAPSGNTLGWGVGRITNLWITDAFAKTNAGLPDAREFTESGAATGAGWHTLTNGAWPADMAYDSTHHLMCAVNVTGTGRWSNGISCWNPASGTIVTNLTGVWTNVPQRGLAYRPDDDTFYIGGWLEAVPDTGITYIYHIKGLSWANPGAVLDQFQPAEPGTSGLAWNPVQRILWQACNSFKDNIYALNPTNGQVLMTIAHPNPGYNGAGLEIDETGNLWLMSLNPNLIYLLNTGQTTFTNAPWLSTSITNGAISPGETQTISIAADSLGLDLGSMARISSCRPMTVAARSSRCPSPSIPSPAPPSSPVRERRLKRAKTSINGWE